MTTDDHVLWERCSMTGSHVAHCWPPTSRQHYCPGVSYQDPRFGYAERLARQYVTEEARA